MKNPKSLILSLVGLLVVTFSAWAGPPVLEGLVKDATGHPIKGAYVVIEAKNFSKIVKTDANGHYTCDGLGVGTYKVTVVISGKVSESIVNVKTQLGTTTQISFNLTGVSNVERIGRPIPYGKDFMGIRVHSANSDE